VKSFADILREEELEKQSRAPPPQPTTTEPRPKKEEKVEIKKPTPSNPDTIWGAKSDISPISLHDIQQEEAERKIKESNNPKKW